MKKAYYYLFYKLYKMSEAAPSRWWSEWKASLALDALIFFFIYSLIIYYTIFIDRYSNIGGGNGTIVVLGIIILLPSYFTFHSKNQWKKIVSDFDRLPKRINLIGSWVVFLVILLTVANLVFAFYLMSEVDWSNYK